MPAERYYIDQVLNEGASLSLEGKEHHHLAHVMRTKVGDAVTLVDGRGNLAEGVATAVGKKKSTIQVKQVRSEPPDSSLILIQAIPRQARLDMILEKGTELGVTEFRLFPAERGERKLLDTQLRRLQGISVAALKQSGRLHLPEITVLPRLLEWSNLPKGTAFGDVNEKERRLDGACRSVVIGPESGLSQHEIDHLRELGATPVTLHRNILRTDTAAICALSRMSN